MIIKMYLCIIVTAFMKLCKVFFKFSFEKGFIVHLMVHK
jgi:hypothetical protein